MKVDAGDPGEALSAGERGAVHDSRLHWVILVTRELVAFAERAIQAGLRSEATDEQTDQQCQKQYGGQKERTQNAMVNFERHSNGNEMVPTFQGTFAKSVCFGPDE